LQEKHLNLFDLLLEETYPWETLHDEHKIVAIEILARLIAAHGKLAVRVVSRTKPNF
jgi:hypothetical protein